MSKQQLSHCLTFLLCHLSYVESISTEIRLRVNVKIVFILSLDHEKGLRNATFYQVGKLLELSTLSKILEQSCIYFIFFLSIKLFVSNFFDSGMILYSSLFRIQFWNITSKHLLLFLWKSSCRHFNKANKVKTLLKLKKMMEIMKFEEFG